MSSISSQEREVMSDESSDEDVHRYEIEGSDPTTESETDHDEAVKHDLTKKSDNNLKNYRNESNKYPLNPQQLDEYSDKTKRQRHQSVHRIKPKYKMENDDLLDQQPKPSTSEIMQSKNRNRKSAFYAAEETRDHGKVSEKNHVKKSLITKKSATKRSADGTAKNFESLASTVKSRDKLEGFEEDVRDKKRTKTKYQQTLSNNTQEMNNQMVNHQKKYSGQELSSVWNILEQLTDKTKDLTQRVQILEGRLNCQDNIDSLKRSKKPNSSLPFISSSKPFEPLPYMNEEQTDNGKSIFTSILDEEDRQFLTTNSYKRETAGEDGSTHLFCDRSEKIYNKLEAHYKSTNMFSAYDHLAFSTLRVMKTIIDTKRREQNRKSYAKRNTLPKQAEQKKLCKNIMCIECGLVRVNTVENIGTNFEARFCSTCATKKNITVSPLSYKGRSFTNDIFKEVKTKQIPGDSMVPPTPKHVLSETAYMPAENPSNPFDNLPGVSDEEDKITNKPLMPPPSPVKRTNMIQRSSDHDSDHQRQNGFKMPSNYVDYNHGRAQQDYDKNRPYENANERNGFSHERRSPRDNKDSPSSRHTRYRKRFGSRSHSSDKRRYRHRDNFSSTSRYQYP